jgi:hypothetical protein
LPNPGPCGFFVWEQGRGGRAAFFVHHLSCIARRLSSARRTSHLELRTLRSDFFGFFGAQKKGDFFGARPKKVHSPGSEGLASRKARNAKHCATCASLSAFDAGLQTPSSRRIPMADFFGCAP